MNQTVMIIERRYLWTQLFNSLRPSDVYDSAINKLSHRWIMACHLLGIKPLSEPILAYYQLEPKENISIKKSFEYKVFI